MAEPRITAAITANRGELARRERAAVGQMAHAFAGITNRMAGEIAALEDELQAIIDAGERPTIGRIYRMQRYRSLLAQAAAEFDRYGQQVGAVLGPLTREAVDQATRDAAELTRLALGPPPPGITADVLFTKLPTDAIADIVATTRSGPLAELLGQFGAMAAHDARTALIYGIALGEHPSRVARRIQDSLGTSLSRATTIARTEQLRAYREGHRRWYDQNSRVIKRYVWHSALGRNTCVACWALHGTEFDTKEPMGAHPNCRCTMVPVTKTWRELGYNVSPANESTAKIERGPALFRNLKPKEQLHILGPKAFAAYRAGDIEISDLIHTSHSDDWGTTRSRGSLKRALARAQRRGGDAAG